MIIQYGMRISQMKWQCVAQKVNHGLGREENSQSNGKQHNQFQEKSETRSPSGLRKTTLSYNSLAHKTTWLRSDLDDPA